MMGNSVIPPLLLKKWLQAGGGTLVNSTDIWINLKNLSDTKVLCVTKDWLKILAHAMRAQNAKTRFLEQLLLIFLNFF